MAHLQIAYRCIGCNEIPDEPPLFTCKNSHTFCRHCFETIRTTVQDRSNSIKYQWCEICKSKTNYKELFVEAQLLQKLKLPPGIGRPCRYNTDQQEYLNKTINNIPVKGYATHSQTQSVTTEKSYQYVQDNISTAQSSTVASSILTLKQSKKHSKKPLICFHNNCKKCIATSSLLIHYKYDHLDVPKTSLCRNKELQILIDISKLNNNCTTCLSMLTLYDDNNIDVRSSKSIKSVIKTCVTLSGTVPVETFWLMLNCNSSKSKSSSSYIAFWLFANCDQEYFCTLKLSSKSGDLSQLTYCNIVPIRDYNVTNIIWSLNCLFVNYSTFIGMLENNSDIILSVIVH